METIKSVMDAVHQTRPGISQVIATAASVSKSELVQRRGKHRQNGIIRRTSIKRTSITAK